MFKKIGILFTSHYIRRINHDILLTILNQVLIIINNIRQL